MDTIEEKRIDKDKTFQIAWLESSYLETLFPGTPWQNINDMLSLELAQAVRKQFNNPHRKQMIIELLGTQFKRSYLADEADQPFLLYPPNMNEEQRKKLENEAKSWLQIQINEIGLKKGCAVKSNESDEQLCAEMKDYLEHSYNIISTSLDRHLYSKQNKINSEIDMTLQSSKNSEEKNIIDLIAKHSNKNDLRGVYKNKNILQNETKSNKLKINLTSEYSELLSESLLSILMKDPRRIAFIFQKFAGQQLTNNLRRFIWSDVLLRNERKKIIDPTVQIDIDLLVRKNFANGVTRGKNELKLTDPSQTPVTGLIENAVIETYSRVFSLNELLFEQHLRQTMKVLNVLYTYSRDYEPYYIYWLLPFQLAYNQEKDRSELIYDLGMYLDLFVKNNFPAWSEIFTIAGKVMHDLSVNDPKFYEHLKNISKINPKVNPKDFVNEIIYNENKKSINHLIQNGNEQTDMVKLNKELLIEPAIFIRKWIGECFCGILRKNALLYVWDQFFMGLWASSNIEIITKVLIFLLRNQFMSANDYDEMRKVFLEEPCKLFTSDIQSAFMLLSNGGKETDVPFLNRRDKDSISKNTGYYTRPNEVSIQPKKKSFDLGLIGFKHIRLILVVPQKGLTADFDPSRVIVDASLYYGNSKLHQRHTENVPLIKDIRSSLSETKTYDLTIQNEKLILDISEFNQDTSSLKDIFSLISIRYQTRNYSEVMLGYCKCRLFSPQNIGSLSTWDITHGEITKLLHPGIAPKNLESINEIPTSSYKDRLGPGSSIKFTIFDAKSDRHLNST